jgi:hypothetical protein
MSLTSLLRESDVRERFNADFEKPRFELKDPIAAVPTDPSRAHAALVGTAFDYVLRLHVSIINDADVWARHWTAEIAVDRLADHIAARVPVFPPGSNQSHRGVISKAQRIIREARREYDRCHEKRQVSEAMLRYALLLAQLEQFYRGGMLSASFGKATNAGVTDLKNLLAVAQRSPERFRASRACVLNPDFREASYLVGGADADILIDDTLVEIKTTKELKFTAETFRQLVGYFLLYKIGRGVTAGPRPKPQIRSLGVYFSRYGVFRSFPVDSVIYMAKLPSFLRWFKQRATNGPPPIGTATVDGVTFEY